jgi:hypothetical protein
VYDTVLDIDVESTVSSGRTSQGEHLSFGTFSEEQEELRKGVHRFPAGTFPETEAALGKTTAAKALR